MSVKLSSNYRVQNLLSWTGPTPQLLHCFALKAAPLRGVRGRDPNSKSAKSPRLRGPLPISNQVPKSRILLLHPHLRSAAAPVRVLQRHQCLSHASDAVGRLRRRARRRQLRPAPRAVRAPGGPLLLEGQQCTGRVFPTSPRAASSPSSSLLFLLLRRGGSLVCVREHFVEHLVVWWFA
jgi:hypothetical protein